MLITHRLTIALIATTFFLIEKPTTLAQISSNGIVIESVGPFGDSNIRVNDLLYRWQRQPTDAKEPDSSGEIRSAFEWLRLGVEEAPRGPIKLMGERQGELIAFDVPSSAWDFQVRPRMPNDVLELYLTSAKMVHEGKHEEGLHIFDGLAQTATEDGEPDLACWFLFRSAQLIAEAGQQDLALSRYEKSLAAGSTPESRVALFGAIGKLLHEKGEFRRAQEAYEQERSIHEQHWGRNLGFARATYNLGVLAWRARDLDSAGELLHLALELQEKLAPGSLNLAFTYNSLGSLSIARSNLATAETYLTKALEIQERWRPGSRHVAASLNNLAVIAERNDQIKRALELHRRALEIRQKENPNSEEVADSLSNLGVLFKRLGNNQQATDYYELALQIKLKTSPDSLTLAGTLTNLGSVAADRGDLDLAEDYYRRASDIIQRKAPESPEAVAILNNYANILTDRGDLDFAATLHKKALKIQEEIAPDSLEVARSLNNLGTVAREQGHLKEASELFKASAEIKKRKAPGSLSYAIALTNLGMIAGELGDLDSSEAYYKRAVEIRENLAPESLDIAIDYHNLSTVAWFRGNLDSAEDYALKALKIREKFAPGSLVLSETLHDLGAARKKRHDLPAAIRYFNQAIAVFESQLSRLGGPHQGKVEFRSDYSYYYQDLSEALLEQNDTERAFEIYERSRAQVLLQMMAERDLTFSSDVPEELIRQREEILSRYDNLQREIALANPIIRRPRQRAPPSLGGLRAGPPQCRPRRPLRL